MSSSYLDNRLKYHAASRVAAKEADPLLNALNLDQHTTLMTKVWASPITEFPLNTGDYRTTTDSTLATDNLVSVFKSGASYAYKNGTNNNDGLIWTNSAYPAVKLFENVTMTPVANSNGTGLLYEAYEILDSNGLRYMDWVSPMGAFDPNLNKPIPGFAGKVEVTKNGSTWTELQNCTEDDESIKGIWALTRGNWEFIYSAGIVTFNAAYTPAARSYTGVRFTGFLYDGTYLDEYIDNQITEMQEEIHEDLAVIKRRLKNVFAGATLTTTNSTKNLDTYITPGVCRITNDIDGTKPAVDDLTGYLQVMEVDHYEDTDANSKYKVLIRQIVFPDSISSGTPYTRNGQGTLKSGVTYEDDDWDNPKGTDFDMTWSDWTTLGGNLIRKKLTDNQKGNVNIMYYSFGNYTLTLPDPSNYPLGTQIGLEQYLNYGAVVYDGKYQGTSPAYGYDTDETTGNISINTTKCLGCTTYLFTITEDENKTGKFWYLEADKDITGAIANMNTRLGNASVFIMSQLSIASDNLDSSINLASSSLAGSINSLWTSHTKHVSSVSSQLNSSFANVTSTMNNLSSSISDVKDTAVSAFNTASLAYNTAVSSRIDEQKASQMIAQHLSSAPHGTSTAVQNYTNVSSITQIFSTSIMNTSIISSTIVSNTGITNVTSTTVISNTNVHSSYITSTVNSTAIHTSTIINTSTVIHTSTVQGANVTSVISSTIISSTYAPKITSVFSSTVIHTSTVTVHSSNITSITSSITNIHTSTVHTSTIISSTVTNRTDIHTSTIIHTSTVQHSTTTVVSSTVVSSVTSGFVKAGYWYSNQAVSATTISTYLLTGDVGIAVDSAIVTLPTCIYDWAQKRRVVTVDCQTYAYVTAGSDGSEGFTGSYTLPFEATFVDGAACWRLVVAG